MGVQPAETTNREKCVRCGLVANIDPSLHAERYDHNPAVWRDGRVLEFDWTTYTFGIEVPRTDRTAREPSQRGPRAYQVP